MQSSKFKITMQNAKNNKNQNEQDETEELEEEFQKDDQSFDETQADEKDDLEKKCEELENKWKRALADYQNLEKRVRDDKSRWIQVANRELIARLLPVLDTLMLAEKHTEDQGIKMSVAQFIQALESEGAKRIKTVGEDFDPNIMEAVGTAEGKENKVVEELRVGVTIGEYVIRPAQVIVGKEN